MAGTPSSRGWTSKGSRRSCPGDAGAAAQADGEPATTDLPEQVLPQEVLPEQALPE
ncbi:MAG TPA: hypothetical protein VGH53_01395 [Streptosporangiaceae bacterium]